MHFVIIHHVFMPHAPPCKCTTDPKPADEYQVTRSRAHTAEEDKTREHKNEKQYIPVLLFLLRACVRLARLQFTVGRERQGSKRTTEMNAVNRGK